METLDQIKADAVEVFHFDRECRPQDRARAYEAGRAEVAGANLVQNLRRQLTSIEATVGDAIGLLDESVGGGGLR